jgi:hypothetical protein
MIHEFIDLNEYLKESIFSGSDLYDFLSSKKIGILILLTYKKAKQWPYFKIPFKNEDLIDIPLLWAFMCVDSNKKISLFLDIHPMKCFPLLYSTNNNHNLKFPISIVQRDGYTLAGCLRDDVNIAGKRYGVAKQHEYCLAFGLPDDCYDERFHKNCFDFLKNYDDYEIWCFEKNNFIQQKIPKNVYVNYMKDEFLPAKNFFYKDTSAKFLSGLFKNSELRAINECYWYQNGKNFIKERNYFNSGHHFRFEESSLDVIKRKAVYELIRELILLKNKDQFKLFRFNRIPKFTEIEKSSADKKISAIVNSVKKDSQITLDSLMCSIEPYLNPTNLRNSHILVMDVEFVSVIYPSKRIRKEKRGHREKTSLRDPRSFKFPCIFTSIIWHPKTKHAEILINTFTLPCHYCREKCWEIKNHSIGFNCLHFADSFISNQIDFFEQLLAKHESLKIFSYGKSDFNQLEYSDNFFNDSFDPRLYMRKNRKRQKRIIDLVQDISESNVKLEYVEKNILEKWILGWSRKRKHLNVNRNFTVRITRNESSQKYKDAIETCALDTISTFLFLLYKNYRKNDDPIKWERSVQGTLHFL